MYPHVTDNSRADECGTIVLFHLSGRGLHQGIQSVVVPTPTGFFGASLSPHPCLVAYLLDPNLAKSEILANEALGRVFQGQWNTNFMIICSAASSPMAFSAWAATLVTRRCCSLSVASGGGFVRHVRAGGWPRWPLTWS